MSLSYHGQSRQGNNDIPKIELELEIYRRQKEISVLKLNTAEANTDWKAGDL